MKRKQNERLAKECSASACKLFRNELGYCSINYWPTTPTSFQISGNVIAMVGTTCTNDYAVIPGLNTYLVDEYCGGGLGGVNNPSGIALPTTISSKCG